MCLIIQIVRVPGHMVIKTLFTFNKSSLYGFHTCSWEHTLALAAEPEIRMNLTVDSPDCVLVNVRLPPLVQTSGQISHSHKGVNVEKSSLPHTSQCKTLSQQDLP